MEEGREMTTWAVCVFGPGTGGVRHLILFDEEYTGTPDARQRTDRKRIRRSSCEMESIVIERPNEGPLAVDSFVREEQLTGYLLRSKL